MFARVLALVLAALFAGCASKPETIVQVRAHVIALPAAAFKCEKLAAPAAAHSTADLLKTYAATFHAYTNCRAALTAAGELNSNLTAQRRINNGNYWTNR